MIVNESNFIRFPDAVIVRVHKSECEIEQANRPVGVAFKILECRFLKEASRLIDVTWALRSHFREPIHQVKLVEELLLQNSPLHVGPESKVYPLNAAHSNGVWPHGERQIIQIQWIERLVIAVCDKFRKHS